MEKILFQIFDDTSHITSTWLASAMIHKNKDGVFVMAVNVVVVEKIKHGYLRI